MTTTEPLTDLWSPSHPRYAPSVEPRRLLALDGGGVRGIVTLRILRKIEALGREAGMGDVLSDWFHYIGGTSSGAIIAAGLARGMCVEELEGHYLRLTRDLFVPAPLWERLENWYDDGPVARGLREIFGVDTTLAPEHLRCLLLVVTQNVTTDSPWPISSNIRAKYNDPAHPACNLELPLWRLLRASTAAPVYFPPEVVPLGDREFVFVDGGATPYNNPAFLLYRMATSPEYRLGWRSGEDRMLLVSVGSGDRARLGPDASDPDQNILSATRRTLAQLRNQASVEQDTLCRTFGRCVFGAPIDRELGDMIATDGTPRAFRYARYDADLAGLRARQAALDAVASIPALIDAGESVAAQVRPEHFGRFLA